MRVVVLSFPWWASRGRDRIVVVNCTFTPTFESANVCVLEGYKRLRSLVEAMWFECEQPKCIWNRVRQAKEKNREWWSWSRSQGGLEK